MSGDEPQRPHLLSRYCPVHVDTGECAAVHTPVEIGLRMDGILCDLSGDQQRGACPAPILKRQLPDALLLPRAAAIS
jgi:hypothetical protein